MRRELQARIAQDNQRMAVEKSLERQAQKQADAAAVREQLQQVGVCVCMCVMYAC